jgi:D-alanyl-D-alanine carboxypeptidase
MRKRWGLIISIMILGSVFMTGFKETKKDVSLLDFVQRKKDTKNIALVVQRNGERIYSVNEDVPLPLASMMKTIVAIEYANQLESGKINKDELVPLTDLNKYYVPNTDGKAHETWENQAKKQNDHVTLSEVAKGMIHFSSNANTDYLLAHLGIQNVNNVLKQLNLQNHTEIVPLTSSLYVPGAIQQQYNLSEKETLKKIKSLSKEEYRNYVKTIHSWMDDAASFKDRNIPLLLSMDFQRVWSDRLPAASANDYLKVATFLNNKKTFSPSTQQALDEVMEPYSLEGLTYIGEKGGSTGFVFTNTIYATDKQGNKTEITFMGNDLNLFIEKQGEFLNKMWLEFMFRTLMDEKFRESFK